MELGRENTAKRVRLISVQSYCVSTSVVLGVLGADIGTQRKGIDSGGDGGIAYKRNIKSLTSVA